MAACPPGLIAGIFCGLGIEGVVVTLFAAFFIDAMLIPVVPELFALFFFTEGASTYGATFGTTGWAGVILATVVTAELAANALLYSIFRWKRHAVPKFMERAMNFWRAFLIVRDERAILLNRIVPIMPFVGAFIAVSGWDARRSIAYVAIGGFLKYAALLLFIGALQLVSIETARTATYVLIAVLVAWGLATSFLLKRRKDREAARLARTEDG